jgi:hypothetical protein
MPLPFPQGNKPSVTGAPKRGREQFRGDCNCTPWSKIGLPCAIRRAELCTDPDGARFYIDYEGLSQVAKSVYL